MLSKRIQTVFISEVLAVLVSLLMVLALSVSTIGSTAAMAEDEEDEELTPESIYVPIEPAMVTNYGGPGRLRYMSVEVSLRVSGIPGEESVKRHMPLIKDALLNLFAIQTNDSIGSAEGKEALRVTSYDQVTSLLSEEDNESLLEDLLFTGFVVYR